MAEAQCLNWASLLPGWCQRGFDWGDGWIQAKLGCKKSLSTGWWWLHFGGASTKVSPIMFFLWETHLTKVSFQSWITCNFILIYYKFTSLTVPFGLEDLISVLKSILQDESPVAIRQACVSLKVQHMQVREILVIQVKPNKLFGVNQSRFFCQ